MAIPSLRRFVPGSLSLDGELIFLYDSDVGFASGLEDIEIAPLLKEVDDATSNAIGAQEEDIDNDIASQRDGRSAESKKSHLSKRKLLWRPSSKRIALDIVVGDDGPARNASESAEILRTHWSPVFDAKEIDIENLSIFDNFVQLPKKDAY